LDPVLYVSVDVDVDDGAAAEGFSPPRGAARRWLRVLTLVVASALLIVAALGVVGHLIAVHNHVLMVMAVAAPYLMLAAPIGLVVAAVGRHWVLSGVALAVVAGCVILQAPLFISSGEPEPGRAQGLTMMTANLRLGLADAPALVETARRNGVDVLTTQELTADAVQRLNVAGLDRLLPYHSVDARDRASGVGVWSRFPITTSQRIGGYEFAFVAARIAVPGVTAEPIVAAVHMPGPWPQPVADWAHDLGQLPTTLKTIAEVGGGGAVLVGGDFNATPDVAQFRRLLRDGYHDAADQAGAGVTRTYPGDSWLPPVIAIDHVLTHGAVATSVRTVSIEGSDHRGLVSRISLSS
jgi:endonuclease/exonuclease/phosphatase (EEP) superfamily protein YafD